MTCPGCGAQITGPDSRFCPQCGCSLEAAASNPGIEASDDAQRPPARPRWPKLTPRQKLIGALIALALIVGGVVAAQGTTPSNAGQTSGAAEDAGSQYFPSGYPLPSQVDSQLTQHIQQADGADVQYHSCQYFAPALGPPPVYDCTFEVDGVWHDNIQATGHPDGSFSWQDDTSGVTPLQ